MSAPPGPRTQTRNDVAREQANRTARHATEASAVRGRPHAGWRVTHSVPDVNNINNITAVAQAPLAIHTLQQWVCSDRAAQTEGSPTSKTRNSAGQDLVRWWPPVMASAALSSLWLASNGAFWSRDSNWTVTADACSWFGVDCGDGANVTGLNLASNNLTGPLVDAIGQLTTLRCVSCVPRYHVASHNICCVGRG